jgi:hypothetical protein
LHFCSSQSLGEEYMEMGPIMCPVPQDYDISGLMFNVFQIIVSYRYCPIFSCFISEAKVSLSYSILAGNRNLLMFFWLIV